MAWNGVGEKKAEVKRKTADKVVELRSSGKGSSAAMVSDEKPTNESVRRGEKDLQSGMELLELNFLLNIVEDTKGADENDVAMRKLNFDELLRREKLDSVDSNSLKDYAVNHDNMFDKYIQREALKELTTRTTAKNK